jgi:hypothetical protein
MVVFCVPGSVFAETGDEVSTVADTKYAGEVTCSVYQGGTTDYGGSDTYRKMVGSHERSGKWNYYANNEIYLSAPTDESGGKAGDFTSDLEAEGNSESVQSGTERYFTVDSDRIFTNPDGTSHALVIIGTRDVDLKALALTNIKLHGYKLSEGTAADEITAVLDMSDVYAGEIAFHTAQIYDSMVSSIGIRRCKS